MKIYLTILIVVFISFVSCINKAHKAKVSFILSDTIKLKENDLIIFSTIQIIDTLRYISYNEENIYQINFLYSTVFDTVKFYNYYKKYSFRQEDVLKNDFVIINNQKIVFDSLLCINSKVNWYRKSYCQEVLFINGYVFSFNNSKFAALLTCNNFSTACDDQYLFIFKIMDNLEFIDVISQPLSNPNCISDFNSDGNLDVLAWNVNEDTIKMYSIIEKKLQYSNEFLKIEYPKEKNYEPCIIVSQSNFSLLSEFIKKINKDFE